MRKLVGASLCIFLSSQSVAAPLFAQNPDNVAGRCAWHFETLGKDYDPRDSHLFATPPKIAKQIAETPIEASAKIVFAAPVTTLDVRHVYPKGKQVTGADVSETKSNLAMLKTFGRSDSDRSLGKANFTKMLDQSPESYIVLVGHNEGGQFHFLDGSTMDMEDIADECAKRHKVSVLISCKSQRDKVVGSTRDLTFAEAFCIAGLLKGYLSSAQQRHEKIAPASLQTAFAKSEGSIGCNGTLRFFVLAGCAGAGIAFAIVIVEAESKKA
jgi:hypothetical protein